MKCENLVTHEDERDFGEILARFWRDFGEILAHPESAEEAAVGGGGKDLRLDLDAW